MSTRKTQMTQTEIPLGFGWDQGAFICFSVIIEPQRPKTFLLTSASAEAEISPRICAVWLASLLSVWRQFASLTIQKMCPVKILIRPRSDLNLPWAYVSGSKFAGVAMSLFIAYCVYCICLRSVEAIVWFCCILQLYVCEISNLYGFMML